jgi:hypothetical protein
VRQSSSDCARIKSPATLFERCSAAKKEISGLHLFARDLQIWWGR